MSIDRKWVLAVGMCTWASVAQAHISITMGGTHDARSPSDDLKEAPCGAAGSTRSTNVYTYKPGETINISIVETISHPGYFRIAFDDDGNDDFVTPSGTDGASGNCAGDPACGPGKEDYCNNETVLLDHLDTVAALAPRPRHAQPRGPAGRPHLDPRVVPPHAGRPP
jgi:hypothetical protein